VTLTTYDDGLWRIIEPNVCNTRRRIEVLEEMQRRNIPTVVWLSPILPFINDTEENIGKILDECIRVGVKGIMCFGMGLTLREGDREYYYAALDKNFPGLKKKYINTYGNAYELQSPNNDQLMRMFERICRKNNILCTPEECFSYLYSFPEKYTQMSIFDLGYDDSNKRRHN
jgi:DNA repair photolyase